MYQVNKRDGTIVDYDREVFMKDFLYDAIMDTENGYSLSYEILKDYEPTGSSVVADIPAETKIPND